MENGADKNKRGFTLIEILVVLAITAMLSSLAIVYTHAGQNQISLSIEESKIAQLILQARELSIATYGTNSDTCAYGVHFDYTNSTYSLFAYNSAVSSTASDGRPICPSLASTSAQILPDDMDEYAGGSWQVHVAQGVKLINGTSTASDTIQDILFYPPNPFTLVSLNGDALFRTAYSNPVIPPAVYIYLSTSDGSASRVITINPAGQVNL